mmetsp:Transcript_1432/g.3141  ORF Transcript_1432/g.3141 Transcript_1432/m.3141 type:complete len:232 (+) Transcript_1432:468-1163(+)
MDSNPPSPNKPGTKSRNTLHGPRGRTRGLFDRSHQRNESHPRQGRPNPQGLCQNKHLGIVRTPSHVPSLRSQRIGNQRRKRKNGRKQPNPSQFNHWNFLARRGQRTIQDAPICIPPRRLASHGGPGRSLGQIPCRSLRCGLCSRPVCGNESLRVSHLRRLQQSNGTPGRICHIGGDERFFVQERRVRRRSLLHAGQDQRRLSRSPARPIQCLSLFGGNLQSRRENDPQRPA